MTNMNVVIAGLLALLVSAGAATAQDLDGTLKKIKDSATFTLGYKIASSLTVVRKARSSVLRVERSLKRSIVQPGSRAWLHPESRLSGSLQSAA